MAVDLYEFFETLADPTRLKILGLLATSDRRLPELARLLELKPVAVARQLRKLAEVGLVTSTAGAPDRAYALRDDVLKAWGERLHSRERAQDPTDDSEGDAWERRVLDEFRVGGMLKVIPAQEKKRLVVLRWLADQFRPGIRYPEAEVNEILRRHHPDFALLRRSLVDAELMQRQGGIYWRAGTVTYQPPERETAT
jgi:DNA-binding transcriptional ArsR family regulator